LKITPQQVANTVFYQGKGCKNCRNSGYLGRLPIFEFLVLDSDMRDKLTAGVSEAQIRAMARQRGYGGLLESGVINILKGFSTPEEVIGVAFMEDVQS